MTRETNTNRTTLTAVIACALCACMLAFGAGCTQQTQDTASSSAKSQQTQASFTKVGDTSSDKSMNIKNETGQTITALFVSVGQDVAVDAANLLTDATWTSDETIELFAPPAEATSQTPQDPDATDVIVNAVYALKAVLADGTQYTLHNITFGEGESGEVALKVDATANLAYLVYYINGQEASTLEAEKASQKQLQEAQAAAEAAAAAQAEAEAAAQAQAEAAAQAEARQSAAQSSTGYTYNTQTQQSSSAASAESSAGVTQQEDKCIDDLVLK